MRELRNTKIIAVDHGYGNMKTANTVTPTGIKAYETEPIFTGNILEYNGIYYRIGEGHKEFSPILYHHRQLKSCISSKPPQYPYYTIKNNEITTRVHEERKHNISFFSIPAQFPLNPFPLCFLYTYLTAKQYHTGTIC